MKKYFDAVAEFSETFGKLNSDTPTIPNQGYCEFLHAFLLEELTEFKEAYEAGDIVEVADAFTDILYVLIGGYQAFGLEGLAEKLFDEVQRSNMSKSCATEEEAIENIEILKNKGTNAYYQEINGKFILYRKEDGKVQKPANYSKPDLRQFFQ